MNADPLAAITLIRRLHAPCSVYPCAFFPPREHSQMPGISSTLDQAKDALQGGVVAAANVKSGSPQTNGAAVPSPAAHIARRRDKNGIGEDQES